jgi:hypothetical protein
MDGLNLFLVVAIGIAAYTWFAGMSAGPIVLVLVIVGMLALYLGGKQYMRESFEGGAEAPEAARSTNLVAQSDVVTVPRTQERVIELDDSDSGSGGTITTYRDSLTGSLIDKPREVEVPMKMNQLPYATTGIMSLYDYDDPSSSHMLLSDLNPDETELDTVAANTGERSSDAASRAIKNQRVFDKQFEWSNNLPPNSVVQQTQQSKWKALQGAGGSASTKVTEGFADSEYASVSGAAMVPPDLDSVEAEERKILQTFEPVKSTGLGTYDPDDVQLLLDKVYTVKGKRASYVKRDDGVYEVFETEDLDPKITYEDEEEQPKRDSGDGTDAIAVPQGVAKYAAALDPFFEPRQTTRPNRADYTAWTPGLERMFAPTEPKAQWY